MLCSRPCQSYIRVLYVTVANGHLFVRFIIVLREREKIIKLLAQPLKSSEGRNDQPLSLPWEPESSTLDRASETELSIFLRSPELPLVRAELPNCPGPLQEQQKLMPSSLLGTRLPPTAASHVSLSRSLRSHHLLVFVATERRTESGGGGGG